jgi:amidase
VEELKGLGATVIDDPFAGTGFADLKYPIIGYDKRGSESVAYDFYVYLQGLGIDGLDELKDIVGVSPFDPDQPLGTLS